MNSKASTVKKPAEDLPTLLSLTTNNNSSSNDLFNNLSFDDPFNNPSSDDPFNNSTSSPASNLVILSSSLVVKLKAHQVQYIICIFLN